MMLLDRMGLASNLPRRSDHSARVAGRDRSHLPPCRSFTLAGGGAEETNRSAGVAWKRCHERVDADRCALDAHADERGVTPAQRARRKRDAWCQWDDRIGFR